MLRHNLLGFVDRDAVQRHQLVVRLPLDMASVRRLADELDGRGCGWGYFSRRAAFHRQPRWLPYFSFIPYASGKAIDFVFTLVCA